MEQRRGLMWPFTHASSSRNISIVIEIMPSAVSSRTINKVATSAEREQMGERLLGRRCLDTSSPGRRLARLKLAALCPGLNKWLSLWPECSSDGHGRHLGRPSQVQKSILEVRPI